MRHAFTIPRKLALTASIVGLLITSLVGVATAKAWSRFPEATINGPIRVESEALCSWTATTNISNPQYEWSANGQVIGTGPIVYHTFYHANGAHQGLSLLVYNDAGDSAADDRLIGVLIKDRGHPPCYP